MNMEPRKFVPFTLVVKDFFASTSMHGLKYITEEGRRAIERVVWIVVFCLGVLFSVYMCLLMWKKFDESPVLMSVETTEYPLANLNFPTITICSTNKISKAQLTAMLDQLDGITSDDMQLIMKAMNRLDSTLGRFDEIRNVSRKLQKSKIGLQRLLELMQRASPTCENMVVDCVLLNMPIDCNKIFQQRTSDEGLCCSFNTLPIDWSSENATTLESSTKVPTDLLAANATLNYPFKVSRAGIRNGLTVMLDTLVDDYGSPSNRFDGFKVLIHNAHEFPDVSERGFFLGTGLEVSAAMEGATVYSTPEAEALSFAKRKCLLDDEMQLQYFDTYSPSNCYIDCISRAMIEACGCVPFYFSLGEHVPKCDLSQYECIATEWLNIRNSDDNCPCPPSCNDSWFSSEVSAAQFPGMGFTLSRKADRFMKRKANLTRDNLVPYMKSNVAMLNVYFKGRTCTRYRRDIRYGMEDFISAMGGLLGLGFGFSFISAVEILYFFLIRWWLGKHPDQASKSKEATNGLDNPAASFTSMQLQNWLREPDSAPLQKQVVIN